MWETIFRVILLQESNNKPSGNSNAFVAVTGITGVPTTALAGNLTLSATVEPSNATNKTINWSITNMVGTSAYFSGSTLITDFPGSVKVRANIPNGKSAGTPYTQDFIITILQRGPDMPKNVKATAISSKFFESTNPLLPHGIRLEWTSVYGAEGYKIFDGYSTTDVIGGSTLMHTYRTDNKGIIYYFQVWAYNSNGEGPRSPVFAAPCW